MANPAPSKARRARRRLTNPSSHSVELGERGARFNPDHPFVIAFFATLGVGVALGLLLGLRALREIIVVMGLALFIAVGLDPAVRLLNRWLPRWLSVLVVALTAFLLFAGFMAAVIPPLSSQATQFAHRLPGYLKSLERHNGLLGRLNARYHIIQDVQKKVSSGSVVSSVASSALGVGKVVAKSVTEGILVIVLTLYFLAALPRVKRTAYRLTPASRRQRVELITEEILRRVGGFVLGNLTTSVIAGLGTFAWLTILGVPYPLLLALFVAFFDLVPIVGSSIAGLIVSLVALAKSIPVAVATLAFYVIYRFVEDYLLTPRVMSRTVEVSGLVTVVAVLVGGSLLGIVGALVAIPVAAAIQLVFQQVAAPSLEQM